MLDEILKLKEEGLTQKAIADRLGLSIGKVKYRLAKLGGTRNGRGGDEGEAAGPTAAPVDAAPVGGEAADQAFAEAAHAANEAAAASAQPPVEDEAAGQALAEAADAAMEAGAVAGPGAGAAAASAEAPAASEYAEQALAEAAGTASEAAALSAPAAADGESAWRAIVDAAYAESAAAAAAQAPADGEAAWHDAADANRGTARDEDDRLVLLPKDPGTLYVYWTLTERRIRMIEEHFHCAWDELPKLLRVYDVTYTSFNGDNANHCRDVRIDGRADNWFVRGLSAGTVFCVDLGTTALDGRFVAVLRSGTAETPALHERLRR
ncbi:Winged helix-turn-helix DNA-binding [Paenibacillus sp. UNC496MF]|uniref:DUF4912 domain-containing protein n=1 Tax=Paenibacillus sp. UNC496MF TaxID=1502753 RepID=UPI0008E31A94|nr:DUF4912 domain-containing protein [Paenibacillus sp. UNC496MF]SFI86483.1 Winged helix-turn-helix DNA-binding [Paenibacillus sp. UNC496MF]